jgi:hypothetical protein
MNAVTVRVSPFTSPETADPVVALEDLFLSQSEQASNQPAMTPTATCIALSLSEDQQHGDLDKQLSIAGRL